MSYITAADEGREDGIGARLGEAWGCTFHRFARYTPLDQWVERDGQIVAVAELKYRTHEHGAFADTWLPVRKWLGLTLGSVAHGVPAYYVVEWSDSELGYVNAAQIDPNRFHIEHARNAEGPRAVEPVIEVPLDVFTYLGKAQQ